MRPAAGTVVVPAGDFKSYTIRLQSGVNLRIDANGIIRAARADLYDWYGNQTMVGEGGNYDEPEVNLYAGLRTTATPTLPTACSTPPTSTTS